MYRVLDLFSGIGGFTLGLESTGGFQTVAFCEIDPYCKRVLDKQWPGVRVYGDVRRLTGKRLAAHGIAADVIVGGFPCQDISVAGKRAGLTGARSGLWQHFRRIIGEVRPRYVILENVSGLLSGSLGTILGELAALGYDAIWDCIPASAVGAPHQRDRVWVIAYASRDQLRHEQQRVPGRRPRRVRNGRQTKPGNDGATQSVANTESERLEPRQRTGKAVQGRSAPIEPERCSGRNDRGGEVLPVASGARLAKRQRSAGQQPHATIARGDWWTIEPSVGRVANGVSARVDRLRALGNAVVPQVVAQIGQAILTVTDR